VTPGTAISPLWPDAAAGAAPLAGVADALCDLVSDPESEITRVRVVAAKPRLFCAVAAAAAARQVPLARPDTRYLPTRGVGHITLERPRGAPGAPPSPPPETAIGHRKR